MPMLIDKLKPESTALIVIDMQNDFIAHGAPLETPMGFELLPRLKKLINHARKNGMKVIFTAHAHRHDGCDMGLFGEIYQPIRDRVGLVDESVGIEIYPDVAPYGDEVVIKKRRYSAFFGTDLDIILRTEKIETVVVTGVTTENCCHATARDAMFRGYRVAFISDATGTYDYPDVGFGRIPAQEVHRITLGVLAVSTAHVMTTDELIEKTLLNRVSDPPAE